MAKSGKSVRQAAAQVAEIMAASLSQFPQAEQNKRLRAIHEIAARLKASSATPLKMTAL